MEAQNKNVHAGHRKRMKEKYQNGGLKGFADHEIIEMLLFYIHSQKNTNPTAHNLMDRFQTMSHLFDASYEELLRVDGVGEETALFITFLHDVIEKYYESKVTFGEFMSDPITICNFFLSKMFAKREENFSMITLDGNMCLIKYHELGQGSRTSVNANVRKIAEIAIRDNATGIVICHNHPDGINMPSESDIFITKCIKNALDAIDVALYDHVIVAGNTYISLANTKDYRREFVQY